MRFAFLDGVRALSSLYIVLVHACQIQAVTLGGNPFFAFWLRSGTYAVVVFIVLSGFCLGLPGKQRPFREYIGRRSLRILPPYITAVLLCCLLALWRENLSGIDLDVLPQTLTNLLLLHDLFPDQISEMSTFWTIGIEYRCYWLLPVLLWGLKTGWRDFVAVSVSLWSLNVLCLAVLGLNAWYTWYLPLFAIGVGAARSLKRKPSRRWILGLFSGLIALIVSEPSWAAYLMQFRCLVDLLFGLLVAIAFIVLARQEELRRSGITLSLLVAKSLRLLAPFSYSLYLLHYALLLHTGYWLSLIGITGWSAIMIEIVPIVFCCWLFSLIFERPFLSSGKIEKYERTIR